MTIERAWRKENDYMPGYGNSYRDGDVARSLVECYASAVRPVVTNYDKSVGCDLGCWYGFSTIVLSRLGAARVHGVELNPEVVSRSNSWVSQYRLENLKFHCITEEGRIPLGEASVDWVYINQVLCNARADTFRHSLEEAYRILRRGGRLIFCDSNNPHCPDTVERLTASHRQLELGEGTEEHPAGPTFQSRTAWFANHFPDLAEPDRKALAKGTCYQHGEQLRKAAEDFVKDGSLPQSFFQPGIDRCPCEPVHGGAQSQVTDPHRVRQDLEEIGFVQTAISIVPTARPALTPEELEEALRSSQAFYVYGEKPSQAQSAGGMQR
ncbi:MAG: class I SAM-dependent methyltransferase [Verrucomicrobiales bacterium]